MGPSRTTRACVRWSAKPLRSGTSNRQRRAFRKSPISSLRIFTFLQKFAVAAMAVFAHDALGESSVSFALSYAAFQLILTYVW